MVPVVAVASCGPLSAAAARVRFEREHREHQPGGVGGERAAGQVCQGGVLQVGVDLFDDGVAPVGYLRCHGVQAAGGKEGVVSPQVEQSVVAVRI